MAVPANLRPCGECTGCKYDAHFQVFESFEEAKDWCEEELLEGTWEIQEVRVPKIVAYPKEKKQRLKRIDRLAN